MSHHVNVALEALGSLDAVANCTLSLSSLWNNYLTYSQIIGPTWVIIVTRTTLIRSRKFLQETLFNLSSNKHSLIDAITATDCSFERNAISAMKKQRVYWYMRVMSYTFQSYRPQLCDDSNNISFIFHFPVPETHKAACEIRDCKKKTQTLRGEKKMKQ